ncbi:MAG: molybdenum cofactor guanylyltransferase [Planctomycetia bacterium]|nr:molybdenum cofactor guanylyltransferase [Planctomycetia bacterium]
MKCGGIVLCGGLSRRMGSPKPLLQFGPESMLERVVRLLAQAAQPIVVVAAKGQSLPGLPSDVAIACDERPERGPLEGLRAGLIALGDRADAAYATSCDVPLLVPAFVRRLQELLGDHDIAVPRTDGFFHPLAAVYRVGVLKEVEALLAADRLRPAFLMETARTRVVSEEELRDVDPQLQTLRNLNTPEDYRAALADAGFAGGTP